MRHYLCYVYHIIMWHVHCPFESDEYVLVYHCYHSWVLKAHSHKKRRPTLCHVLPWLSSIHSITPSWVCTMDVSWWWDFLLQSCGLSSLLHSPSCSRGSYCLPWTWYLSHLRCSCLCYDCQCSSFLKSLLHALKYVSGVASKS